MRLGLFSGGSEPIDVQVQQIVDAERDGFDGYWLGQIFGTDALTLIAIAGRETARIELGTAVVPVYREHPVAMAQQALTAQAASNGRLSMGIGLSHHIVVENMWGLSYEKPARYMREYLAVLKPLLTEQKVQFSGEVFRVAGNLQVPVPKPPSLLIAALAPVMLRMAGEATDGTVTWMTGAKTIESHVAPRLNGAASQAGRPSPRICVALPVCVTDDAAGARARAAQLFQVYGQLPNYQRMLRKEGAAGPADVAVVGNEAQVEEQLRAFAAAGATDFAAAIFPSGDDAAASMARTRELLKGRVGKVS